MSAKQQPLVTVFTPVYDGERFLAACIESVLKQTYSNFEYVIVNNCSKDRTLEIAREYAAKDSRIRVHDNDQFLGVIDNHNMAFSLMSPQASYGKMVSADDWIFPTCIERLVALAEANPSVGIVGCYQLSGDVVRWQGFTHPKSVFTGKEIGRRFLRQEQIFMHGQAILGFGSPSSLLYRADLVRSTPAFYPNPSPHSDTSACFDQLRKCDFGFVYDVLSFEQTHTATQSYTSAGMNRYSSATLSDLIHYGSYYLDKDELHDRINETLDGYHRFLAVSYFLTHRDKAFWDYHKGRLQELGYPLKRLALWKAALKAALSEIANPGHLLQKLRKRRSAKRASASAAPLKQDLGKAKKLASC